MGPAYKALMRTLTIHRGCSPRCLRLLTGRTMPKSNTCDDPTHGHAGKGLHIQGMPGLSESRKANMKQMGLSRSYKLPKGTPAVQQWVGTFQKSIPMRAGHEAQLLGCPPTVHEGLSSVLSRADCVWLWRHACKPDTGGWGRVRRIRAALETQRA